jgi:hypothetical protein
VRRDCCYLLFLLSLSLSLSLTMTQLLDVIGPGNVFAFGRLWRPAVVVLSGRAGGAGQRSMRVVTGCRC